MVVALPETLYRLQQSVPCPIGDDPELVAEDIICEGQQGVAIDLVLFERRHELFELAVVGRVEPRQHLRLRPVLDVLVDAFPFKQSLFGCFVCGISEERVYATVYAMQCT